MRRVAVVAAVVVAAAGCGTSSGGRADTVGTQPGSGSGQAASHRGVGTLTAAQIKQRLLRVSDMPSGFTVDTSKDDSTNTPSGCSKLDAMQDVGKSSSAKGDAKFTGGTFGPFVDETVAIPHGSTKALYDRFVAAMRDCPSFRTKNDDGSWANVTISGMSFPSLGDDTFAAQMRLGPVAMVGNIYADLVLVRLGNAFMLLSDAQVAAAPDGSVVERLARTAVQRLQGRS